MWDGTWLRAHSSGDRSIYSFDRRGWGVRDGSRGLDFQWCCCRYWSFIFVPVSDGGGSIFTLRQLFATPRPTMAEYVYLYPLRFLTHPTQVLWPLFSAVLRPFLTTIARPRDMQIARILPSAPPPRRDQDRGWNREGAWTRTAGRRVIIFPTSLPHPHPSPRVTPTGNEKSPLDLALQLSCAWDRGRGGCREEEDVQTVIWPPHLADD